MRFGQFTNQPAVLRDALDKAALAATGAKEASHLSGTAITSGLGLDPNQSPTAGAESTSGWISPQERERLLNAPGPDGELRRLELRMAEGYRQFLQESEGQPSLAGLRAVIDALGALPGRKSVMYFTEGVPITSRLKARFDALIGQANRANITIYPVDAAGLRAHSAGMRARRGTWESQHPRAWARRSATTAHIPGNSNGRNSC